MANLSTLFLDSLSTRGDEASVTFADPKFDEAKFKLGSLNLGQERITLRQLYDEARCMTSGLQKAGLRPGDNVILQMNSPVNMIRAFWGCVFGGFVPAPLPVSPSYREATGALLKFQGAYQLLSHPHIIAEAALSEGLKTSAVPLPGINERVLVLEELVKALPVQDVHMAESADLALLMFTSGSTGNAKGVMLSHSNLLNSMAGKKKDLELGQGEVFLNWTVLDHVAGLLDCHLLPIFLGASQVHVAPGVLLADPMRFLQLINQYKVTTTFAPNFLFKLINVALANSDAPPKMDLSSLKVLISGGESVVVKTAQDFLTNAAPLGLKPNVVRPAFGMTETAAGITFSRTFPAGDANAEFAGLGAAMDGLKLRIVCEETGHPFTDPNQAGALQVSGATIFGGYIYNKEATGEAFSGDGWFNTGDRGMLTPEGALQLMGRNKDSIIINGANFYSHELETCLADVDGVMHSCIAAVPTRPKGADTEQLALFIAILDGFDARNVVLSLRDRVLCLWGVKPSAICVLQPEEFPKSSLGKILRTNLRKDYEAAVFTNTLMQYNVRGNRVAPRNETEAAMVTIWNKVLDVPEEEISVTSQFLDLGGTSMDVIKLKMLVDERFKIDMPLTAAYLYPTIEVFAPQVDIYCGGSEAPHVYLPVVQLNNTGDKEPLFLVHPGVGEVLVFTEMAKRFRDDRPVYAFRARGFHPDEPFFDTMEEMADTYVEAMQKIQPHGPYYLTGYSYGGVVAFEVAKRLEAQGEHIHFCGILNVPPHIKPRMHEIQYLDGLLNLMLFVDLVTKDQVVELNESLKGQSKEEVLEYCMSVSNKRRLEELQLTAAKLDHWVMLAASLITVGKKYDPTGLLKTLSVFYAIPLRGTKQEWVQGPLAEWNEFSELPIEFIEVPGHHYTLMSPQYVDQFIRIYKAALDRTAARAVASYQQA